MVEKMDDLSVEAIDGVRLYYRPDTHDYSMLLEVWEEKCYGKYFPFGKRSVIVDIGAQNGYFSVFAATYATLESSIYAYEPMKDNFDILAANITLNRINSITAQKMAVSNTDGMLTLFVNSVHTGGHSVFKDRLDVYNIEQVNHVLVPSLTFARVVPDSTKVIDFCKIDCEGAEFDILLSADEKQLEKVSVFAIEFHEFGGHKVEELKRMFESIGYSVEISYTPSKRGIVYGLLHAIRMTTSNRGVVFGRIE